MTMPTSSRSTRGPLPANFRKHLGLAEGKVEALLLPTLAAAPAFRRPANDYTFDVKYYGGDRVEMDRTLDKAASDVEASDAISLYLHFPLCPYICRFCHYHVRASTGRSTENSRLLEGLHSCASVVAESLPAARLKRVSSIYLGGGTPSLLRVDELAELLRWTRALFQCGEVEEITVETTPDSVTREWLEAAQALGVNRVSSGVQVLDDKVLAFMGRKHTTADVRRFLEDCRAVPGLTTNVDLIAGLPLVTEESWLWTLHELVEQSPASITVYRLRLGRSDERQSSLSRLFEKSPELFPPQERVAVQMLAARGMLLENGYQEGPVGWFWRGAGQPKCYRDRWLLQRPLLGIGESAYSYGNDWQIINAKGQPFKAALQDKRWPATVSTLLAPAEGQLRRLAWSLRATGEVPAHWAEQQPELQTRLDQLEALGLTERQAAGSYHLTEMGTLLIDEIIRCMLHLRAWDRGSPDALDSKLQVTH
jgi:coproporphyrinogen III oxidase-like Fe-S oxidoreductase